jgi:DnaJ-class molecular chaperone
MVFWLIVLAAAVLAVTVYLASLRIHPWTSCRRCSGGGKSRDRIWRGAYGTCKACGGRGRKPRAGIRILTPGRHKQLTVGQASHKSTDKRKD